MNKLFSIAILAGFILIGCGSGHGGEEGQFFGSGGSSSDDHGSPVVNPATGEPDTILLFATSNALAGDFARGGLMSARERADMECLGDIAGTPGYGIRAFLSIDPSDTIALMPSQYGVPTDQNIVGKTGTKIADNWADLLDGSVDTALGISVGKYYWSGSTWDGDLSSSCGGWMSSLANGTVGSPGATGSTWLQSTDTTCDISLRILCIAYKL